MQNIFITILHLVEKVDKVDNMIFFIGPINKKTILKPQSLKYIFTLDEHSHEAFYCNIFLWEYIGIWLQEWESAL